MSIKRYAIVGLGSRAAFYYNAITRDFKKSAELVAFVDVNQTRMNVANKRLADLGAGPIKTYKAEDFDLMVKKMKPDFVIVTTIDRVHHKYICRAMELGCNAITEKPMTIDEFKCQEIVDTIKRTGRELRVTFNYRYAPHNTKVRELIMEDTIGQVTSVHFEWLLNTTHGGDFFRRWHRDQRNSGGLLVHKSTHHFDLVNFWLGTKPETVFAFGGLMFYGRANAEGRGVTQFYTRAHGSEAAKNDPFAIHLEESKALKELYLDAEHEDGYHRDQSVFGDGISIDDTAGVIVRYANKAIMTYNTYAYAPYEGFRVNFNGTKGRIEMVVIEEQYNPGGDIGPDGRKKATSHVFGGAAENEESLVARTSVRVLPMFGKPYDVEIQKGEGGHGGGDPLILNDVLGGRKPDRFNRAASHVDGAMSILTAVAANNSCRTGEPVRIADLVKF